MFKNIDFKTISITILIFKAIHSFGGTLDLNSVKKEFSPEKLKTCISQSGEFTDQSKILYKLGGYEILRFTQALKNNHIQTDSIRLISSNESECLKEFLEVVNNNLKKVDPNYNIFDLQFKLSQTQLNLIKKLKSEIRNYNLFIYNNENYSTKDLGLSWTVLSGDALLSVNSDASNEQMYKEIFRQVIHEYYMLRDLMHDSNNIFSNNEYSCIRLNITPLEKMILANYRGAKFEYEIGIGPKVRDFKTINEIISNYYIPQNLFLLFSTMDSTDEILEIANKARCEIQSGNNAETESALFDQLTTPKLNFGEITFKSVGPGCEGCAGGGWFVPDQVDKHD